MAKPKETPRPTTPPKFKVGDTVRVKHGIRDTDYPDIPLGGWAGKVTKVYDDGMYTIRWSQETLTAIHPVVKSRCEKDGTDLDQYQLGEDDMEIDSGGPLVIEQPAQITVKPLSPKDEDDRIRMVFGLASNDPLPEVDDETLKAYHDYLSKNLKFPFVATHESEYGHPKRVKVIELGDPDDDPLIDEEDGILCEARTEGMVVNLPLGELEDAKPNRRLIDDYRHWFWNYR